jgi:hypothetical protein
MANDLHDLDGAEGGPQPAEGRELVIVDLGHIAIMAGLWALPWPALSATASTPETQPADPSYIPRINGGR